MKRATLKPVLLIAMCLFFSTLQGIAQGLKKFTDNSHKKVYRYVKGDTLMIDCDTVIVLNKLTFSIYDQYYRRGQNSVNELKSISDGYEGIIKKQDSLLAAKESYYQVLNTKMDSLVTRSKNFADKSSSDLTQLNTQLTDASTKLTDTQRLLTDAQKMLADENKRQNRKALKFGIGGAVIGAVVAFLIAH